MLSIAWARSPPPLSSMSQSPSLHSQYYFCNISFFLIYIIITTQSVSTLSSSWTWSHSPHRQYYFCKISFFLIYIIIVSFNIIISIIIMNRQSTMMTNIINPQHEDGPCISWVPRWQESQNWWTCRAFCGRFLIIIVILILDIIVIMIIKKVSSCVESCTLDICMDTNMYYAAPRKFNM